MVMRYLWGLAVGHIYTHKEADTNAGASGSSSDIPLSESATEAMTGVAGEASPSELPDQVTVQPPDDEDFGADDPELGFENREDDNDESDHELHNLSDDAESDGTLDDMYA